MTRWLRWSVALIALVSSGARAVSTSARENVERATVDAPKRLWREGGQASDSPQTVVDELLAADRAFSAASAKTDLVSGLTAMFADDVAIPMPPGQFVN